VPSALRPLCSTVPRLSATALSVAALLLVFALGPGEARGAGRVNSAVEVGTARIAGLGPVLIRGSGRALYMFQPLSGPARCSARCERIWPPLPAPVRGLARAIGGARQSLIGSVRDPVTDRRVVTYAGRMLHTYVLDTRPQEATGQDVALSGGFWWVLTAAGRPIRTAVSHGGGYVGS
jgi:predicted lipoprotein with Yx(FWY)xxD motif